MLVKFKDLDGIKWALDSSEIYTRGHGKTYTFHSKHMGMNCWNISEETKDYILNAKAHEGMKRVLVTVGDEFDSALKEITAWFDPVTERIVWDNGEFIKSIDVDCYKFIPYEVKDE